MPGSVTADKYGVGRTLTWIELQKRLGEQKIDIVTARIGEERPIDRAARAQGVPA